MGCHRILIIGLGSVGRRHAENIQALGLATVEVCSEWRGLTEYQVRGTQLRLFQDFEAALDAHPDAVVIANPTGLHARYAGKALEQDCHIYVEKPLAVSAQEALPLAALAHRRNVTIAVGCQLRFNPCLERLKTLLMDGVLGRIIHAQACMGEYLPDYHPDEDYRTSYAARSELGGGVLLTQIHEINYLHWLFGPFDSVYAVGGKISSLEIDVDDSVSFLLRAASGVGVSVHMDFLQRPRRRSVTIIGENGWACWDYYANSLRHGSHDGSEEEIGPGVSLDRNRMFLDAIADFIGCIENGKAPRTTLAEGIADLRVADAVCTSFTSNTLVPIAYDDDRS